MPITHYHHRHLLLIANRLANAAVEDSKRPNALTDDALPTIVMAAAAAEAFINELAEFIRPQHDVPISDTIPPNLLACADAIAEAEEGQGSITLKYQMASIALTGKAFAKGAAPYQDFAELIRIRNLLLHLDPSTKRGEARAEALAARGLAHPATPTDKLSWVDQLQKPETARWAVDTARNMMRAVLDLDQTQYAHKMADPLYWFKDGLSKDSEFT